MNHRFIIIQGKNNCKNNLEENFLMYFLVIDLFMFDSVCFKITTFFFFFF